jgi:hypothetical protein
LCDAVAPWDVDIVAHGHQPADRHTQDDEIGVA